MRPPRPLPRSAQAAEPPPIRPPVEAAPHDPTAVPPGWEGIMVPGERILWQGRPVRRIKWLRVLPLTGFGLLFAGFAVVWMQAAWQAPGMVWMFGLLHVAAGLGLAGAAVLNERMRLSHTVFTLSDRTAYIARRHWWTGRSLQSIPISADMPLGLRGGDKVGDVVFGSRSGGWVRRRRPQEIGFFDIPGAPEVFAILKHAREAQR